jgi:hypothetical protein
MSPHSLRQPASLEINRNLLEVVLSTRASACGGFRTMSRRSTSPGTRCDSYHPHSRPRGPTNFVESSPDTIAVRT